MSVATGARTSFEKFILDRQKELSKKLGKKDYQITPEEYNKAVNEFFGPIPLPEGAVEVSRTPTELIYKGSDGRTYRAFRNTDSNLGIDVGRIETDLSQIPGAPQGSLIANQSSAGEQDFAKQLQQMVSDYFSNNFNSGKSPAEQAGTQQWLDALFKNAQQLGQTPTLAGLDPETRASLQAITDANLAQLNQQFNDQSGSLAAQLFGRGINRSSVAATQAGRLLQGQGLVQQQALSDAAQRELAVRQLLTSLGQQGLMSAGEQYTSGGNLALGSYNANNQQLNQGIALLQNLLQQALQRETAGVSLGLEQQQIKNQANQFDKNYGLAQAQYETAAAQARQAARRQLVGSILSGIASVAAAPFTGGASLIGLGGLLGGGLGGQTDQYNTNVGNIVSGSAPG